MFSPELLIIQLLNGLVMALIFTLIAIGLSLTMGLLGVINMAHGALYAIGAYIALTIFLFSSNFVLSVITAAFATAIIGFIIFLGIVKPSRSKSPLEPLVALIGVNLIFEQMIRDVWGPEPKLLHVPPGLSGPVLFNLFGFSFSYSKYQLFVIGISIILIILIYYLLRKSNVGIRSLASIMDAETASVMGVDITKVGVIIFIIGSSVAGIGGALSAPIFSIYPTMSIETIGFLFIIVITGGMGSLEGTFLAALIVCETRAICSIFMSVTMADIVVYCILLIVLMFKPTGLKGYRGVLE